MDTPTSAPDISAPFDPSALTPETVEVGHFYEVSDLDQMPQETLEELYLAIPDRAFYDRALREALGQRYGTPAVSDLDRLAVIEQSLDYLDAPLPQIPIQVGRENRIAWVQVPDRVLDYLRHGAPLYAPRKEAKKTLPTPALGALGAGGLVLVCLIFAGFNALFKASELSDQELTATAIALELTGTPPATPPPTPVALDNLDRTIKSGDDLKGYYPTTLEIAPRAGPSRIYPVVQREIQYADWPYEADPSLATSILGFVVQPVLGIAYSPDNETFLGSLQPGDGLLLRMSTGGINPFAVSGVRRVPRQDTALFDQTTPGIRLVLLGAPTADRLVVEGLYLVEQEVGSDAQTAASTHVRPRAAAALSGGLSLKVLEATASHGPVGAELSPDWLYLLVDLEVQATGTEPASLSSLALAAEDQSGTHYPAVAFDPAISNFYPFTPSLVLDPGAIARLTAGFVVPAGLSSAMLHARLGGAAPVVYLLPYAPSSALDASYLDVLVLDLRTEGSGPGELVARVRFYNPTSERITVRARDLYAVFSPAGGKGQFPVGPPVPLSGDLPLVVLPGAALDVELRFSWDGSPYVGLTLGGYQFIAQLK